MTRFQYSNAVKDLLQLRIAVFSLPEQLAREYGNYYKPASKTMPSSLKVGNRALGKSQLIEPRLVGVTPYPQDLRAEHGFDNQADQLSLSPLLLEQFMELSQSVVNAANFDAKTVGVWPELFALPADDAPADLRPLIAERLRKFLTRAYRQPSNTSTEGSCASRSRYVNPNFSRDALSAVDKPVFMLPHLTRLARRRT